MLFKYFVLLVFFISPLFAEKGYQLPWGKDADLNNVHSDLWNPKPRTDLFSKAAEAIILFHQNVISPVDGPRSNFRPTSARYMLLAIRRYGFIKGYIMGCDRLLRENKDPWYYRTVIIDGKQYKWDPTVKGSSKNFFPLIVNESNSSSHSLF